MFLKNKNISSKNKRSKVTDYAALRAYMYIKVRTKLGHSVMNGHNVSYKTVRKWRNKCHTGTEFC